MRALFPIWQPRGKFHHHQLSLEEPKPARIQQTKSPQGFKKRKIGSGTKHVYKKVPGRSTCKGASSDLLHSLGNPHIFETHTSGFRIPESPSQNPNIGLGSILTFQNLPTTIFLWPSWTAIHWRPLDRHPWSHVMDGWWTSGFLGIIYTQIQQICRHHTWNSRKYQKLHAVFFPSQNNTPNLSPTWVQFVAAALGFPCSSHGFLPFVPSIQLSRRQVQHQWRCDRSERLGWADSKRWNLEVGISQTTEKPFKWVCFS